MNYIANGGVALRKESVDRNWKLRNPSRPGKMSLSARRAWIEIKIWYCGTSIGLVALRKESVDRNLAVWAVEHAYQLSLSARRAWIEMRKGLAMR